MNIDFMFFPNFISGEGGIYPNIPLPRDYKNLIEKFKESGRVKVVEDFAREVDEFASKQSHVQGETNYIRLGWDGGLLKHIGLGIHGGLDLEERGNRAVYQTHNLGGLNGIYGAMIAINYVSELMKVRE